MKAFKFDNLPLGSVSPSGILKTYCLLQAKNITGNMELYDDFSSDSGWLGGDEESWERGPYYARGLVALAYTIRDENLIKKAKKWIDFALNSQKENGDFGPNPDMWCKMPMLNAIRDYYEAELFLGREDKRVLPFFEKYFLFQSDYLKFHRFHSWAKFRGADNVEVLLWYIRQTEGKGLKCGSLRKIKKLARTMLRNTYDWEREMRLGGKLRHHVVNTTQGFKQPYLKYCVKGKEKYLDSLFKGLRNMSSDHGRTDGLPNADEAARDNSAVRGTETCAVVEGMLSLEIAGAVSGQPWLFDMLESYAYNNMPNCFDYDMSVYCYFQLQNQVLATHGTHGFVNDHGDSSAYGIGAFECCFSNCHSGFPKFIQNMWMKQGNDLVLTCYGASVLDIVLQGKRVVWEQKTLYPYDDKIKLVYKGEDYSGKIKLRIPGWAVSFTVNGKEYETDEGFAEIEGSFRNGDEFEICAESEIKILQWHCNSRYVRKGTAIYCLPIKESWREIKDFSFRGVKYAAKGNSGNYEVFPDGEWRYTLKGTEGLWRKNNDFDESEPVSPENVPCSIDIALREVKNWQIKGNVCQDIGGRAETGKSAYGKLIPTSACRLKITLFPEEGKGDAIEASDFQSIRKILDSVADVPEFDSTVQVGYGVAMLSYPVVKDATYSIIYGENGKYSRIIEGIANNPYIFGKDPYGKAIKSDKYAIDIRNNTDYVARVAVIKKGKIDAVSKETVFRYE